MKEQKRKRLLRQRERWPCLRTGVLCSSASDPLKRLLVAEEALRCCSTPHVVDEGFPQVLLRVQDFVVPAGAGIHGQSLQQPHAGDDHVDAGVHP